jgi:hypothetical protein
VVVSTSCAHEGASVNAKDCSVAPLLPEGAALKVPVVDSSTKTEVTALCLRTLVLIAVGMIVSRI